MAVRYEFSGVAAPSTISGSISPSSTTITISIFSGWPIGTTGPFAVVIDRGTAAQETVLISSRSGNTLTVANRGWDGTIAASHSSPAKVEHVWTATQADQVNRHVADTTNDDHTQYVHVGTPRTITAAHSWSASQQFNARQNFVSSTSPQVFLDSGATISSDVEAQLRRRTVLDGSAYKQVSIIATGQVGKFVSKTSGVTGFANDFSGIDGRWILNGNVDSAPDDLFVIKNRTGAKIGQFHEAAGMSLYGRQNAVRFIDIAGVAQGLVGQRNDLTGNERDVVVYTYNGDIRGFVATTEVFRLDGAGTNFGSELTSMFVRHNNALKRVIVGPENSAGSGYRYLRIDN